MQCLSDQSPIIGIWGMGGVGKTTLAGHICTRLQSKPDKFHIYWVTISQNVNINKLQNDLAKKLNLDGFPKDGDTEEKAAFLHEDLAKRKNVVLILDDVWKYLELRHIGILLGLDGCNVIMTSRSLDVCNQMGCKSNIKIQPLSDKEAWGLFLKKLDPANMLNPEVEKVAKEIAKKCGGLPLAVATIARSMKGVDNIHRWRNALAELEHTMRHKYMKNEVLPILLYSYNRLDENLQQCFLYCALYPEDYCIGRNELVTNFISEGMMNGRDNWIAKSDVGHTILDELVNACLLENVEDEEFGKCVKMHDLLRVMAIEITSSNPKFMAKAGLYLKELPDEQEWKEDLDKVSLKQNWIEKIPKGLSPKCPRLSTLILSNNRKLSIIPNSFFAHMNGLRVLDLRKTKIEKLPSSISELENLTALLLGKCYYLWYVPPLNKLEELRELDISWTKIKEVPEGLECLVKLQYLNMSGMNCVAIPRGLLSRFSLIQRLILPHQVKVDAKEVELLRLLEEFQGRIDDLCNSKWFNKSPSLNAYKIFVGQSANCGGELEDYGNSIIFHRYSKGGLKHPLLPKNMKCLIIKEFKGLRDCLFDTFPSLYNCIDLRKCVIAHCNRIESIMRISDHGSMKNLEKLRLEYLPNFIGLIKMEPGSVALPPCGTFPSLKMLTIENCPKIKKLFPQKSLVQNLEKLIICDCVRMEEIIGAVAHPPCGTFSSLKQLWIEECHSIKKLFPQSLVQNLQNLEKLIVCDCYQMEEIIEDEEGGGGVSSNSSSSTNPINVIAFPKLTEIMLERLPELKSIYKGTINCCDTIENILIIRCSKLERLPFFHVSVDEKPPTPPLSSSSSSSYYNNSGASTYIFPKLRYLALWYLPELKTVCDGRIVCDSIEEIRVGGCRQLSRLNLLPPLIRQCPSPPPTLRKITISGRQRSWWESLE